MATFFGEVLPVTSRAVDEDEEEDDVTAVPTIDPVVRWTENFSVEVEKLQDRKIPCTVFILALSVEANAFSDIYLKPFGYEPVGEILPNPKEDVTSSQSSTTDKTCSINRCRSNPAVYLCQCKVDILPEHSYAWVKLLIDRFDLLSADIIILTSSGMSGYCSDLPFSDLETPFLRCLKSESFTGFPKCKILEQPNMVTGVPAQLMTFCQVYGYRAVTYVCFKEKRYMDIADIKAFIPLLQTKAVKDITEVNKNAEQMLREAVKLHSLHDMMYM
ncbi:unnamed protein product [Candidula unifasciata]|uniref:Proteasome assembly chaperone 1 n=1 Tax=Candidula unifasciata TaxID=100452 RepID=A0A8S3YT05_9EUPU|nr:unnamed protein product [Candidula unifasciata]